MLHALKIIKEEFESAQDHNDPLNQMAVSEVLDAVEARILERIKVECIEVRTVDTPLTPGDPEPHPDHCLCDDCVTLENMDAKLAANRERPLTPEEIAAGPPSQRKRKLSPDEGFAKVVRAVEPVLGRRAIPRPNFED